MDHVMSKLGPLSMYWYREMKQQTEIPIDFLRPYDKFMTVVSDAQQ